MNRKKKKVVGAIAIEAVLSLTIFMLAILALMMGSLLMRAQSSMQYALNQTAKEISGYFYLLDKFGIASMLSENTTENADADLNQLNTTIGHIFAFSGDLKGDAKTIKKQITETNEKFQSGSLTKEDLEELKAIPANEKDKIEASIDEIKDDIELLKSSDKKVLFKAVIQVFSRACINTAASKYLTPFVCKALMPKYLTDGDVDTYYNSIGVIPTSINFDGSHILGDGRTISLVVEYQIDASKLTLGFYKKNLTFRQVAVTSAWIQKNESGSLQDLKTVGKYFNEGYVKEHAEELKLLKEKNDAEAAEAEKKAKEEAEAVSKALTKTTTTTTDTKKTDDSEDSDTTTTTTTTEAVLSEDIKAFIDKYPEGQKLYDTYGPDVVRAVNKCSDPRAAIALILAAEKGDPAYGEDAVKALNKSGDKAVAALKKVPSQKCAQVVAANGNSAADIIAANGPEAVTAIGDNDSPKDAIKAIEKAADKKTVIAALNYVPTKDCAVAIMRCNGSAKVIADFGKKDKAKATEAVAAITKGIDCKNDQGVLDALVKRGDDALRAFTKATPTKECTDLLITYGETAADAFAACGDDAVDAVAHCESNQKKALLAIAVYENDAVDAIKKGNTEGNGAGVVDAIDACGKDAFEVFKKVKPTKACTDALVADPLEAALVFTTFGDDAVKAVEVCKESPEVAIKLMMEFEEKDIPALTTAYKNGYNSQQISDLKELAGLTPKDYDKKYDADGRVHNLVISSPAEADALIQQNKKIHSLFSDKEISEFKEDLLINQEKYRKATYKKTKASPAYAGVAYRNKDGVIEYFYDYNKPKGEIPDNLDKAKPGNKDLISQLKNNLVHLDTSEYTATNGAGTHAEVFAVCKMLEAHPDATVDDFIVFVDYTTPFDKKSVGHSFYTCPHCREILNGLNILSNVEAY